MSQTALRIALSEVDRRLQGEEPALAHAYDRAVAELKARGVTDRALRIGDIMPAFGLLDTQGRLVSSGDLLAAGPLVISFYRGAWCYYCEAELAALRAAHPAIVAAGGTLVAIAAEAGSRCAMAQRDLALPFDILCDLDLGVALSFGLVFRLNDEIRTQYLHDGLDFRPVYGNDSWFLPVPATYVVGADGIIATAFVDADFRRRMSPEEIVAALESLKRSARS